MSGNPTNEELQSPAEETGPMTSSLHTRMSKIGASRIQGQASLTDQAECRRTGLFPRQRKWESVGSAGTQRQKSYNAAALAPGGRNRAKIGAPRSCGVTFDYEGLMI
jgi:hypothetical protein